MDREEYQRCYDVFRKLRNRDYLNKIKADEKARQEYERRSQEQSRSDYKNFYDNYRSSGSGSYSYLSDGNYNKGEKAKLKQFYRTLSKVYHPDSNPDRDTSEEMKLLNQLKHDWGI